MVGLSACSRDNAPAPDGGTDDGNTIRFTALAGFTVSLCLSATSGTLTQEDVDNATVVIKDMCLKDIVGYDGTVTTFRTLSDFTPLKSTDGGGNQFRTILFPQTVQGGIPWIEITVGGKTVTYPVPVGLTDSGGGESPYSTYLAGWYRNSNYDASAYTLVNGALTVLLSPADGANASPKAMAVSGGRTYVTGDYFATSNGAARACYWVDGAVTKLDLPDTYGTDSEHAESILVSGGSIHTLPCSDEHKNPSSDGLRGN